MALAYIQANRAVVEAEYEEVLQTREEIYHYWEERNRDRLAQIEAQSDRSDYAEVRAKLKERKLQRAAQAE